MSLSEITFSFPNAEQRQTSIAPADPQQHGKLLILDPEQFYEQHAPRLFNVARRILKDHELAEDAVQEAFKNIFQHVGRFRGESKLETWMTRIVVNVCLGYLRKNKNRLKAEVDHEQINEMLENMFPDNRRTPYESVCRSEAQDLVHKGIRRLKKIHREVIWLHDIKEKTLEEISHLLEVPVGTIKSRLFYGRQELAVFVRNLMTRQAYHPS
jgi:RNA polymerase sigma-70 factor (ECF subfamily)